MKLIIEDPKRLHHINRHSIATLPEHDDWPFLTKKMFAISGDSMQEGTYRSQIIHFGGTFKAIEWEWDKWLEKFEELLKKLYWDEVNLHLRTELVGSYNYRYLSSMGVPVTARNWNTVRKLISLVTH